MTGLGSSQGGNILSEGFSGKPGFISINETQIANPRETFVPPEHSDEVGQAPPVIFRINPKIPRGFCEINLGFVLG